MMKYLAYSSRCMSILLFSPLFVGVISPRWSCVRFSGARAGGGASSPAAGIGAAAAAVVAGASGATLIPENTVSNRRLRLHRFRIALLRVSVFVYISRSNSHTATSSIMIPEVEQCSAKTITETSRRSMIYDAACRVVNARRHTRTHG